VSGKVRLFLSFITHDSLTAYGGWIFNLRTRQLRTQHHVLASFPVDKDTRIQGMGGWDGPGAGIYRWEN